MLADSNAAIEGVYRTDWGRIVASLIRLVGDFDVAAVKGEVKELFGDFASPTPYVRVPQPLYPTKAEPQRKANVQAGSVMRS